MQRTSWRLRALNALTRPGLRTTDDPDAVFDKLVAKVASGDFANYPPTGAEGLRQFLYAWADTRGVSGIGWQIAQDYVRHHLDNRMRVQRLHAQTPWIGDLPVPAPVFVVGMPRTATTLTHQVLAGINGARGPQLWEMFAVDNFHALTPRQIRRRQQAVERQLYHHLQLSPGWDDIHPMRATDVEEDTFLKDHSVMNLGSGPMPGYWKFLTGAYDAAADFELLKASLQVLSLTDPMDHPPTWVLKHPGNLFYLEAIFQVFPDARIVWCHRDPATALGSMCSMAESLHRLHLVPAAVRTRQIGAQWLELLAAGIDRARDARVALTSGAGPVRARRDQFIDVHYETLTAEPHREVAALADKLGLRWTAHDAQRLTAAVARPRAGGRRHEYALDRYGVSTWDVDHAFGDYMPMLRGMTRR
jgi:hypothetical protein